MKTLAFSSLLLLFGFTAFGQDSSQPLDQAPAPVDEALRARVNKFYELFIAGKFKEAYSLVADDSQDKFFELSKEQYKGCEIIKINYSDNFTKAAVVTSCKRDWRLHGTVTLTTFPLTSNWLVVDGQWYWHYMRPTMVPSPFSPTGFVSVPPDSKTDNAGLVPKNLAGAAQAILAQVTVDKAFAQLRSYETSEDTVRVRNGMPGPISLRLDKPDIPGLKVTLGKTDLQAGEETTIVFEWRLDDPAIQCLDCAKRITVHPIVRLHIQPTGKVLPIGVVFQNVPSQISAPPQK